MNSCSMPAENEVHCHVTAIQEKGKEKKREQSVELIKATGDLY